MIGPGKYDDLCTLVREKAGADGVILIIGNGDKGPGFSMQASLPFIVKMPNILRDVADKIQADFEKGIL